MIADAGFLRSGEVNLPVPKENIRYLSKLRWAKGNEEIWAEKITKIGARETIRMSAPSLRRRMLYVGPVRRFLSVD